MPGIACWMRRQMEHGGFGIHVVAAKYKRFGCLHASFHLISCRCIQQNAWSVLYSHVHPSNIILPPSLLLYLLSSLIPSLPYFIPGYLLSSITLLSPSIPAYTTPFLPLSPPPSICPFIPTAFPPHVIKSRLMMPFQPASTIRPPPLYHP